MGGNFEKRVLASKIETVRFWVFFEAILKRSRFVDRPESLGPIRWFLGRGLVKPYCSHLMQWRDV